jgi:spore germination cell wall hydrolase CwlJ-like protein
MPKAAAAPEPPPLPPLARALPHDESGADLDTLVATRADNVDQIDDETRCMAKVVHHEAANQPLRGQLAVAEVIVHRTRSARFPTTACAVANQPGQFFHIAGYRVSPSSSRWRTAVAVSRLAESGSAPEVVPGALFFHASYVRPAWRHRLVTRIGDQIFYR